jgi:dienelactone hydrolase
MAAPRVAYTRTPYLIVSKEDTPRKDVYGTISNNVVLQAQLLRGERQGRTAIVAMHPIGSPGYLPMFSALARAGLDVVACASRYSSGDAALQMENVLLDLGACVADAKDRLGYEKVVLAGWSGGGSLVLGYQAEAEQPRIKTTAAGEYTPLVDRTLVPADGVLILAAHRSRHHLLTEFLDPSVIVESAPERRNATWNLYDAANSEQAPYSSDYVSAYRARQRARNRLITCWAQEQLATFRSHGTPDSERCFIVYGTMADPRWLDLTLDSNDRRLGSYLGEPRIVNDGPTGLGRYTTARSWLSQWGLDTAQLDGVSAAARISVPILTLVNGADDACPTTHSAAIFDAISSDDKELQTIEGADHYFGGPGQRTPLSTAIGVIEDWLTRHKFCE